MAHAASISIESGPASGGVYTSTGINSFSLEYNVTGNTAVPSATAQCRATVVGTTTQTADWSACNAAPFSHTATPFAPGSQARWSGSNFGLSKGIEGEWTFSVRQTIDAVQYTASRSWAVDDTPPAVVLTAVPTIVNDSTPSLPFTVVEAHPGSTLCAITTSPGATPDYAPCSSPYTPTTPLADGTYYFAVYSTDATGEFSNTNFSNKAFTVDTAPPIVTIEPPSTPTTDTTPSIAFTYTDDNGSLPGCRYYETGTTPGAFGLCSGDNAFDLPQVPDGSWTIDVRYGDAAGNFGTASTVIKVDTTGPDVTVDAPTNGQVFTSTPSPQISAFDPAPDTGVALLQCAYDSDALTLCSAAEFTTKVLNVGSHTLTVKATDGTGNASVNTIGFSIKLPDPPIVNPPAADPPAATTVAPTGATFKRGTAKTKKGRYRPVVKVTIALPAGANATEVCKGSAKLTLTAKGKKKAKSAYLHQVELRAAAGACTGSATFAISKSLAGKKVSLRLTFAGSATLAKFDLSGKIAKI